MKKIKPHCCICKREMLPKDDVILTELYFPIHECCESKNNWGELDRGLYYEVAARHFQYFQEFVHEFSQLGLYDNDENGGMVDEKEEGYTLFCVRF